MICPSSMRPHADRVLKGEYALPMGYEISGVTRVLDIGANVGAFALWARTKWPEALIYCYEPLPSNYKILRENTAHDYRISAVEAAVTASTAEIVTMYEGKNNCGEASLFDLGEQDTSKAVTVRCVPAHELPVCDVLKLDTEGNELSILRGYFEGEGSSFSEERSALVPAVIMLEWHRTKDRWAIGELLSRLSYECVRDDIHRVDRGIMVWVYT